MATIFAESFDMWGSTTDMTTTNGGPWSFPGSAGSLSPAANSANNTQFAYGQSYQPSGSAGGNTAPFSTGTNETTIYGSIRLYYSSGFSSSTSNGVNLWFTDAGTAQCMIKFRQDGAVALYGGTTTLLSAITNVFNPGVWSSIQFKIVIDNTSGSLEVRANGSTSSAGTLSGYNTRAGTSNAYANGIGLQASVSGTVLVDDLYLNNTSGNNPISWCGDVRALGQVPTANTATTFSNVTTTSVALNTNSSTFGPNAGTAWYWQFTQGFSAVLNSVSFLMNTNLTGNVKFAIFDSNPASPTYPGNLIATSNAVNNPTTSTNTATFASPPTLTGGYTYWIGVDQDANASYRSASNFALGFNQTLAYASFPVSNPTVGSQTGFSQFPFTTLNFSVGNYSGLSDGKEDGDSTYVYSSSVQEDTYTVNALPSSYSIVAAQYYVMWKKSDAGSRTAQLSINANSSGDTAEITNSSLPSVYQYQFKILEKDPTGTYWTVSNLNSQVLGIAVTA